MKTLTVGQKVINKKCGPPLTGTIVGIARADFITQYSRVFPKQSWLDNYPDYIKGNLIYIMSDSPLKEESFDEFLTREEQMYAAQGFKPEPTTLKVAYNLLPAHQLVILPEDDVELL